MKPKESAAASGGKMKAKAENFWYYHKWHVIAAVFLLAVVGICLWQSLQKKDPDVYVLYAGECFLPSESVEEMQRDFGAVLREDANGDGKRSVSLKGLVLLTEEKKATALYHAREEEEDGTYIYAGNVAENEKDFQEEMIYGETVVCLLDEAYFEQVRDAGRLASFTELYGKAPEGALDDYGIRIHDLAFGRYFELLSMLPDDTVLCLKKPTLSYQESGFFGGLFKGLCSGSQGSSQGNESYMAQVRFFGDLLEFQVSEG